MKNIILNSLGVLVILMFVLMVTLVWSDDRANDRFLLKLILTNGLLIFLLHVISKGFKD